MTDGERERERCISQIGGKNQAVKALKTLYIGDPDSKSITLYELIIYHLSQHYSMVRLHVTISSIVV